MVGSTSEVLEPNKDIDNLHSEDINYDPLFMLNTDTKNVKVSDEETHSPSSSSDINIKCEIEEQSENDEKNALECFIIVEEAVEEVTTSYDEHIFEICQEDDDMETEQYEDFGYESLSSPEYDYKTHYTSQILTNLIS